MADHLSKCVECRTFQRRLVRLERLVPEFPVPASSAKADCLEAVLHSDAYARPATPEIPWRQRERALRKVAITFAMAAGLLFFALIWYVWQHQNDQVSPSGHTIAKGDRLEEIVNSYDRGALAAAHPRERFQRLAQVALKLQDRTKERVQNGTFSEVSKLAHQYEILVKEGILVQAGNVPEPDRQEVLGLVAEDFSRAESLANNLAKQNPPLAKPLGDMAIVASNARSKLLEIAGI
jgi:hypothetical protein